MPDYIPKLSEPALRWVRFAALLLVLGLLCWIAYSLRTVFTPLLVAAGFAYILNPVVSWFEKRRGVPRLTTVIIAFVLLGAVVLGGGFFAGSRTVAQIAELQQDIPRYVQTIGGWIDLVQTNLRGGAAVSTTAPVSQPHGTWWRWMAPLLEQHGALIVGSVLNYVGAVFANIADLIALLVLIPVFTFYFLWRFNDFVGAIHDHLPAAYRTRIVYLARTIDAATASFFRGRLIICLIIGVLTGLGWALVGVPYSAPLGVLTGALSLVPFLSLLALPPALFFRFLAATQNNEVWATPVTLTMGVYLGVQALDTFLLTPMIGGRTSGLHPLVTVVVLLIGAQLGGLLGALLAIPVASTLGTLAAEWLLPEVRRLAGRPAQDASAGSGIP